MTTTDEHFGLLGALAVSGAEVVVVAPEPEAILAAVTPRTRLIATSQVLWTTGAVLPLAELRAETGVPVLADGAQSVGAVPATAAGVDFLTISGQKWLCGPDATGALVVADPERLALTSPSYFSQREYDPDGSYEPQPGARRFEAGWWSHGTLRAMLAALELRPAWWHERAVGRWRSAAGSSCGRGSSSSCRLRPRRSSPSGRTATRPLSSRGCTRRASTSATSRAAASSASRAAGGRATRISTGSSPRWAEEHRCPTRSRTPSRPTLRRRRCAVRARARSAAALRRRS